jgi:hypothetical protein
MGEASGDRDDMPHGDTPSAVTAIVELWNRAAVDIRNLARAGRGASDPDPLDQIIMIATVCDGLASALGRTLGREAAAHELLAYRWSASGGPARTWMAETLLAADVGYQALIQEWERGRENLMSRQPAPWVQEFGIDESRPEDWRRALDSPGGDPG